VETLSLIYVSFAIEANCNTKSYIYCHVPFTIEIYTTMMTSASETPGNVKRVF